MDGNYGRCLIFSMKFRSRETVTSSKGEKMRSGGPRMLCSPFFVVAMFVMLVFATMKYYSVSSDNENLLLRIEIMQNQIQMTGTNLKKIDDTLKLKNEELQQCQNDRIDGNEKAKKFQETLDQKESLISRLKDDIKTKQNTLEQLQSENVNLYVKNDTMSESIKQLTDQNEELKKENGRLASSSKNCSAFEEELKVIKEELKVTKDELKVTKDELTNLRSEKIEEKEDVAIKKQPEVNANPEQRKLYPGQLPDVNPDAVHVHQPALEGNTYHQDSRGNYLPILPRGDPNAPRAKPLFSVGGPSHAQQKNSSAFAEKIGLEGEKVNTPDEDLEDKADELDMDKKEADEAGEIEVEKVEMKSNKDQKSADDNHAGELSDKDYQDPDGPPDDDQEQVAPGGVKIE